MAAKVQRRLTTRCLPRRTQELAKEIPTGICTFIIPSRSRMVRVASIYPSRTRQDGVCCHHLAIIQHGFVIFRSARGQIYLLKYRQLRGDRHEESVLPAVPLHHRCQLARVPALSAQAREADAANASSQARDDAWLDCAVRALPPDHERKRATSASEVQVTESKLPDPVAFQRLLLCPQGNAD